MLEDLENVSLFKSLSSRQLKEVSAFCAPLSLGDGEMLIHESDRDDRDLYLLVSGSVEIVSNNTDFISGEVVISCEEMDVFGEIAWLTGNPRTASVRCHGNVSAIRVDGPALKRYMDQHPSAGYLIMQKVAVTEALRMEGADDLLKQILWNTTL